MRNKIRVTVLMDCEDVVESLAPPRGESRYTGLVHGFISNQPDEAGRDLPQRNINIFINISY